MKEELLDSVGPMILENKSDVNKSNKDGASPLYVECQEGHLTIVQTLIDNKA